MELDNMALLRPAYGSASTPYRKLLDSIHLLIALRKKTAQ